MNLHSIVRGAIGAINPLTKVTLRRSTGYVTNGDGSRTPTYAAPVKVAAQVQPLQYSDILQLDRLNIQGIRRVMYLDGDWESLVRSAAKGGDLVTLPDNSVWLIALVMENFSATSGWTKVALTLQDNA